MSTDIHDTLVFAHSRIERALRIGRVEIGGRVIRMTRPISREPKPEATQKQYRRIREEERADILAMVRAGRPAAEICAKHNREWAHISYVAKLAGIEIRARTGPSRKDLIEAALLAGKSQEQILGEIPTSASYIAGIAHNMRAEGRLAPLAKSQRMNTGGRR